MIEARALANAGRGFAELFTDGSAVYWVEHRPSRGRSALMAAGHPTELTPQNWSVGSRVHEYGGAAAAADGGSVYFVERSDQRIYRIPQAGNGARPLTPADARRYGDLEPDRHRARVIAVCEDHRVEDRLPVNTLVAVPASGGEPLVVQEGHDFYQAPRLSPDGARLAWIAWDLPRMPWDGTGLYVSEVDDLGRCGPARLVAGGEHESVCHPRWSPDGVLHFVSDHTGWWNLYTWDGSVVEPVAPMAAEVGAPKAMGGAPYDVSATHIAAAVRSEGRARLVLIDRASGAVTDLPTGCWEVAKPRFAGDDIVYLGGSPAQPIAVWQWNETGPHLLRGSGIGTIEGVTEPEVLRIPTTGGAQTHALYYRPADPNGRLVVIAHGGPVTAATAALALGDMALMAAIYWTSRGYAVLDVNYRGSTGYGRPYREALHGQWGVADVDDCVAAAQYLVDRGEVDGDAVVLRGWSAGGYTTLMGLACNDFFAAGTAYFPVADLEAVHLATHKYEAGYEHFLIGDWDRDRERYRERSPITHAAGITVPLLVIQGLDDPVCPADQTERLVARLRQLGRAVDYLSFPGEGHGFSRAESIIAALETEADFYEKALSR
jgi:dipeptidyl aminopeptidase/acylaminoacyl peptidase